MIKSMLSNVILALKSPPNWAGALAFEPNWESRTVYMARLIRQSGTVYDFGCGQMHLEKYLDKEMHFYCPIDVVKRDSRTMIFDGNKEIFPKIDVQNNSICFMAGMLEYINNPVSFLGAAASHGFTEIVVSYVINELVSDKWRRRKMGWVNNLSAEEVGAPFLRCGYCITSCSVVNRVNLVLRFERR